MAFVNDYLTNEEKEVFKQRAIPTGVFWKGGMLGYDPYSKLWCTLDRDEHIYLFDLGKYHDAKDFDEINFALVWDSLSGNEAIHFSVKMDFLRKSIHGEDGVLWHSLRLGLPKNFKSERATIIDKFKEALFSYGINGMPGREIKSNTKFDFRKRMPATLGYLSPVEYRLKYDGIKTA